MHVGEKRIVHLIENPKKLKKDQMSSSVVQSQNQLNMLQCEDVN